LQKLKLAMIGCGAIVQRIHLPVAARSDQVEVTLLVDKDLARAREVAGEFGVPAVANDYRDAVRGAGSQVDAAIVAIPNFLHGPVSTELLQAGIHVLVEKPMALTAFGCDAMIEAADKSGATLTVGLDSRFFWAYQFVKQAIDAGLLGQIQSFELRRGGVFSWPVVSSYTFDRKRAGGGVLMDIGPHVLDLLIWWLGDYDSVVYRDDAMGGVEANCELDLTLKSGISGVVELSRDRVLDNMWVLRGDRATLEVGSGLGSPPPVHLSIGDETVILTGIAAQNRVADKSHHAPYERQLADFCEAIRDHREPFVGKEGKKCIELIEACYASRQAIDYPWKFQALSGEDTPELPADAFAMEAAP
jgi:predicted dehydrogenase